MMDQQYKIFGGKIGDDFIEEFGVGGVCQQIVDKIGNYVRVVRY